MTENSFDYKNYCRAKDLSTIWAALKRTRIDEERRENFMEDVKVFYDFVHSKRVFRGAMREGMNAVCFYKTTPDYGYDFNIFYVAEEFNISSSTAIKCLRIFDSM